MTGKEKKVVTINWLEKQHNALYKLTDLTFELADYSKSFHITGNVTMANILAGIANEIREIDKDIRDAIGENISEEIKRSSESSKAILLAALSGVKLAEGK